MNKILNLPIFKVISQVASSYNVPVYVVGGFVRDALLKRESGQNDIDIVVVGNGIDMAKKIANKINPATKVKIFRNFGTAMFRYQDFDIEFVGARKESYNKNSRKPMVEDGTLEDDQKRRDFTINAMAICLNEDDYGKFIDPFNGTQDLNNKIIRTPRKPDQTFSDDPLRMMRAIRFATQLEFSIEEQTLNAIQKNHDRMAIVSKERILTELNKIILSETPSFGFLLLEQTGLLSDVFPELQQLRGVENVEGKEHKDNFFHTLQVLDNISKSHGDLWLRWAAIMHDIGKPKTKKFVQGQGWTFHGHDYLGAKMVPDIFRKMKLPLNEKMKFVQKMVALHLRPISIAQKEVTDSAVRRLLYDAGEDIEDLMKLCEADITSKNAAKVKRYLKNFKTVRLKMKKLEEKDAVRIFQPPVSGKEIMEAFGLKPSKPVGVIKTAIKEAILDGIIANNHKEAYQYMLKTGKEMGLTPKTTDPATEK